MLEAVAAKADLSVPVTDHGSYASDLPDRADPGAIADIVFGRIWYRILATRQSFDDQLIDDLVAVLATR